MSGLMIHTLGLPLLTFLLAVPIALALRPVPKACP